MSTPAIDTSKNPSSVDVARPRAAERTMLHTAKGSGITFGGQLFAYACRFLITFVVARSLGANEYGLYNLTVSALAIAATLGGFGFDGALVRYIAIYARRRDEAKLWGALQVGLGGTFILSVLFGISLYNLAQPIAEQRFDAPELAPLLRVASFIVPFLALNIILAAATQGFKKMQYATIARDIVQPLIRVVLVMGLVVIGINVVGVVIAYGVAVVITTGMLLYFLHKLFSLRRPLSAAQRQTKELVAFSLPVFLTDLMTTFRGDVQRLLLGALNNIASVGIFTVADQINMIGHMFHSSVVAASRPIISELYDQNARKQLRSMYQTTAKWSYSANLPLFLVLVLFPAPIMAIFGEDFVAGSTALMLLAGANMVNVSTGMCGAVLDMTGHTRLKLINAIVRLVLSLGLNILLIPRFGVIGAATTALVADGIVNVLRLLQVFILLRLLPYNRSFIKPTAAGLAALAVVLVMNRWLPGDTQFAYMVLHILTLFAVYVGMILLLGLSAEDRAVLASVRQRMRGRKERK